MPIQIESATYQNLPGQSPDEKKFQTLRWTITGKLDKVTFPQVATAWDYTLLISASASGWSGSAISAGGLDTLRASFGKTASGADQLLIVTDEAITATAYFSTMRRREQLNPTMYLYEIHLDKVQ